MSEYELHHGDALQVLRGLPDAWAGSGLQRKVDSAPFDKHMTRMAQADHVVDGVGIIGVRECAHWLDVMHIQGSLRNCAAAPTGFVAQASLSTDPTPIWPVIPPMSTTPSGVIFSLAKLIAAGQRAKDQAGFSLAPTVWIFETAQAIRACPGMKYTLSFRFSHCGHQGSLALFGIAVWATHDALGYSQGSAFVVAFPRAEVCSVFPPNLRRQALDWVAANRACKRHGPNVAPRSVMGKERGAQ